MLPPSWKDKPFSFSLASKTQDVKKKKKYHLLHVVARTHIVHVLFAEAAPLLFFLPWLCVHRSHDGFGTLLLGGIEQLLHGHLANIARDVLQVL